MRTKIAVLMLVCLWIPGAGKCPAQDDDFYAVITSTGVGTAISSVPYTITSSGFYYLTKDLGHSDTESNAITVGADDVTIDLMGFHLIGPGKTSGTNSGIYMFNRSNVEVRNGTIRDFGADGVRGQIWYVNPSGNFQRMLSLRLICNGERGIWLQGYGHAVRGCSAEDNGEDGILVGSRSLVAANYLRGNAYDGGVGLSVSSNSVLVENVSYGNRGSGIRAGSGCVISANAANASVAENGLEIGEGSAVTGNTTANNHQYGLYFTGGAKSLVDQNTSAKNTLAAKNDCAGCVWGTNIPMTP